MVRKDIGGLIQLRLLVLFSIILGLFAIFDSTTFAQNSIDNYVTMDGYFNIGEKRYEDGTYVFEYYLFTDDGSRSPYFLKFNQVPPNVFDLSGNQVTIQGNMNYQSNNQARFFSNSEVMDVNSIALSNANQNSQLGTNSNNEFAQRSNLGGSSERGSDPQMRSVPSTLKTVVILSRFSGDATEPHAKSYFQSRWFTDSDSLKRYWEDTSYGAITMSTGTIDGTGVVDWQSLSNTQSFYDNSCNFLDLNALDDSIILADPFVDFNGADNVIQNTGPQIGGPGDNGDDVDQVIMVFNDILESCALFAFAFFDPIDIFTDEGTMFVYPVWTPDMGDAGDGFPIGINFENGVGAIAHEMGHNFEWEHTPPSVGIDVGADPWSIMSAGDADGPPGAIAFNRDQAGWIPPADVIGVLDGEQKIFTLDTLSNPSPGSNFLVGVIPFSVDNFYTVEARIDSTFDQTPLNQAGLLIYHFNPLGHSGSPEPSAPVSIVDTTGTGDFDNSDLEPGVTWDTGNNIWITNMEENVFVNGENTVTIKVHVNNNAPCLPPSSEDWIIVTNCTMPSSATAPANVIIQNNSVLTVPTGMSLDINFVSNFLRIESGSGVLIESGGTIKSLSVGMGDLIINEVMIDPALPVSDSSGEWVELYNPTSFPINLQGAVLSDDGVDSHTITSSVIVPSNGFVVLGIDGNFGTNGGVVVDYQYSSFFLGNSGDEVVITFQGTEIDRVDYDANFDVSGASKELSTNHLSDILNDILSNWCAAVDAIGPGNSGTPGSVNSCAL